MIRYCCQWLFKLIILGVTIVIGSSVVGGILPEASQEGILRPFKSYADVTLFHYSVPPEVSRATWEFAAFMDNPKCPIRNVHIFIQHGSYPVISPSNSSFPPNVITKRTSFHSIETQSAYEPHDATIFPLYNPLPGNWFAAAFIADWDQQLQQEGLARKCHYSLGSVALWSQVVGIPVISPGVPRRVTTLPMDHISYFKIFIPAGTWHLSIVISDCVFLLQTDHFYHLNNTQLYCMDSITLKAKTLPASYVNPNKVKTLKYHLTNITQHEMHVINVTEPYTENYYYLLVISESQVEFQINVIITECYVQQLGHSLLNRQFSQATQSAITVRHSNNSIRSDWASTILFNNDSQVRNSIKQSNTDPRDAEEALDSCLLILRLARIKHVQDFADTFLLPGREWYTTWLPLNNMLPVVVQLEILPFVDIGGTLSISIHLDELLINVTGYQLLSVTACIRKGRVPSRQNNAIVCPPELMLKVTSEDYSSIDAMKLIPYPEPDMWFVAFQAKCIANDSEVPCIVEEIMVSLDIRTQPCAFAGDPCGVKGICQKTHKGLHFFTSCTCLGGFRGWGCTDSRNATPEWLLLLTTLLLTLSNIFFLPAITLALRRHLLTEALVYLATMIFSTFYHACDQQFYTYCVTKYEVLQFCDFFCSILAFWVTLIAIAGIPTRIASTLHMLGVLIIAVGVEYNRTGLLVFIIPFGLGVVIPVVAWLVRCCKHQGCIHFERSLLALLLPGILLAATGLVLFAFIETEANYQYVHSAWHIIIALSLVFLLPRKCSVTVINNTSECHDANAAELFDVNDYYSASPVFFITSDLDNLVT